MRKNTRFDLKGIYPNMKEVRRYFSNVLYEMEGFEDGDLTTEEKDELLSNLDAHRHKVIEATTILLSKKVKQEIKEPEILFCPFCGSADVEAKHSYSDYDFVKCNDCGAIGSRNVSRQGAIEAWNNVSKAMIGI